MTEDSAPVRSRRLVLAGAVSAAATSSLVAGCTELGGRFERPEEEEQNDTESSDTPDPVERDERDPVDEERGFGDAWEVPDSALTVTLAAPQIRGQVGQTSAPRDSSWASVTVRIANDGEERDNVDADGFYAIVDDERYDHDTSLQGALRSGIVEPGETLEKALYFAVPADATDDAVAVRYEDLVRWG